jgi:hypothetical protein
VELLPKLIEFLPEFKTNLGVFKLAMESIFNFMSKNKEKKDSDNFKGAAFIALGKISLLVSQTTLSPYLDKIFDLIDNEIKKPALNIQDDIYYKPLKRTDVLSCIRDLAKNYGCEIEGRYCSGKLTTSMIAQQELVNIDEQIEVDGPGGGNLFMYDYIASLFYFGFKKPLIEALKELTKICGGKYKMGIQTKLMNTIYIILNHNQRRVDYFPVQSIFTDHKKNQIQKKQHQQKKKILAMRAAKAQ